MKVDRKTRKEAPPQASAAHGITGREVALALGVTPARVRQMRSEGKLSPLAGSPAAFPLYPLSEVERLRERQEDPVEAPRAFAQLRTGVDEAIDAFKLFESGASIGEIVLELRMIPAKVRALYREWSTPLASERAPIDAREARRQAIRDRETRAKEARQIDADYTARMSELDKDAPRLKRRSFDHSAKARLKRQAERAAREQKIRERLTP